MRKTREWTRDRGHARGRARGRVQTRDRGLILVVVLILLVVIGLTAAAAMRGAITQEKVANNLRLEHAAQTQAEFALRYCEAQLLKDKAQRVAQLQDVDDLSALSMANLRWNQSSAWAAPSASNTNLAFHELDAALLPSNGAPRPQCLVERLSVGNGGEEALVVTARGFSPGYQAASSTALSAGSTVWLQSFLYFE